MPQDVTRHVVTETYDVCVVGGGLSGTCAALAAARHGAKTALVTDRPVLGGNSSSELRIPPCGTGYYNPWGTETGLVHELILEDRALNHDRVNYGQANGVWDYVLYNACRSEPKLTLHLNTSINQVTMTDPQTIAEISGVQAGSATTLHVPARYYVDASGDGCVGVGAGVPFRIGAEPRSLYGESEAPEDPDDFVMGNTLTFRARDVGYETTYTPPSWAQIYDYPDGLPLTRVDAALVERALSNLLDNALRVTPAGGRVTVKVRPEKAGVRVEVVDTGPGVLPEDQPKVFDRFFQTSRARDQRGASGLGLAIVKRVAELHGGQAGLRSEPGRGSTFFIELPLSA